MKIKKVSKTIPDYVYHGSPFLFDSFDTNQTVQRLLWFTEDPEEIISGKSGALSNKYIYKCRLKVSNPANREQYEKLTLDEISQMGHDSIELEGYWAIFDENDVEIIDVKKND